MFNTPTRCGQLLPHRLLDIGVGHTSWCSWCGWGIPMLCHLPQWDITPQLPSTPHLPHFTTPRPACPGPTPPTPFSIQEIPAPHPTPHTFAFAVYSPCSCVWHFHRARPPTCATRHDAGRDGWCRLWVSTPSSRGGGDITTDSDDVRCHVTRVVTDVADVPGGANHVT